MTEQFKLVTNAQESKIFESNATAIRIKCSNNFPQRYIVSKLPTQDIPLKNGSFQARKSVYKWRILIGRISWRRPRVSGELSGVVFWRRSRHAKRVAKPRGIFKLTCIPTLLAAPRPKQYNTPSHPIQYNTILFINSPRGVFQNWFTICIYNTTKTNDIHVLDI